MEFELEKENGNQISQEIALNELRGFVKEHTGKSLDDAKLLEQYPAVITGLESGNLTLGDSPAHKLFKAIKNDDNEVSVSDVTFKTRILPSDQRKISKGLDLKADQLLYGHRCIAFLTNLPTVNMLDKFGKTDYALVEQLSTLFT